MNFETYQFYEHTLINVETKLATKKAEKNTVIVTLEDCYTKVRNIIFFENCSNIIFEMDFDILKENIPYNTSTSKSTNDKELIELFVKENKKNWDVETLNDPDSEINMKLRVTKNKFIHEIRFFGGRLRVVSQDIKISEEKIY